MNRSPWARLRAPLRLDVAALVALAVLAACSRPLPDAESEAAVVYVQQCGLCHPAHHPGLLTAEMWKIQVARMAEMRARRNLPALTAAQEKLILDYLTSHAG